MMNPETAVQLIDEVLYTTLAYASAWQRGIKGDKQRKAKLKAVKALFKECVGREPTEQELEAMGANVVAAN